MSTVAFARPEVRFSERVEDLLQKVDYRLANTPKERDRIYRLRYEAYLREGAIPPDFSKRLSDRFDDADNAWIFGVFIDGDLASSIRLNVATPSYPDLPAMAVFSDMLAGEADAGKVVIDPTRFVADHQFSRQYPDLRYATTRIAWMAMEHFGGDLLLASARAEHQAFYRRVFGHEVVCEPRSYYTLLKPLSLMVCDYARQKDAVNRRFPFFRSTYFERRMLFEGLQGMAPATADELPAQQTLRAGNVTNLVG
jgi:hypothetical protein